MTDHPTVDHNGPAPDDSIFSRDEKTLDIDAPKMLGPYVLSVLLGRGGMGEVWKGLDGNLERDVAIKLMRKELLANEEAVKRFSREARAVARLNHPNIVQVYTFGDDQGVLYMVMEMVEGDTVSDRLKELGTMPLEICVGVMLQTIEGLAYANARGIIHRDIKPSNLMLTPDFRVKIADFGLAKMIEQDTQMTAAGTTMGSPNYMSPEQARGEEADHRSDIYALGISLFQMLTGKLPFTAQTAVAVLLKHIQEPLPANELICAMCDGKVQAVVTKMTEKNPDDRYQTYGGLAAAIAALAPQVQHRGGHAVTTSIASTPQRDSEPPTRVVEEPAAASITPPPHSATQTPVAVPVQEKSLNPYGVETRANSVVPGKSSKALWWVAGLVILAALGAVGAYIIFVDDSPNVNLAANQPNPQTPPADPNPAPTATTASTPVVTPTPTAATPVPTQAPTPIPTPIATPFTAGPSTLILGAPAAIPGSTVAVLNQSGVTTPLIVGTTMEFTRTATVNGISYYVGKLNGQEYLVPTEQASVRAGRFVAPTSTPAVTILRLGTPGSGPDEMIAVFRDDKAVVELQKLPAGTTVTLIQERVPISKVALPNGQQVFVYRGMTQKQPAQ